MAALPAQAHVFSVKDVTVEFEEDGGYSVEMIVDVDALALGVSPSNDDAEMVAALRALSAEDFDAAVERARSTLARRVRLRFDGEKQRPSIDFPQWGTPEADEAEIPTVLGTVARFRGRVPEGAEEFTFGASRSFQTVRLTIHDRITGERAGHLLAASEESPPFRPGRPSQPAGRVRVLGRYTRMGFEHILPGGLDHILFVLGLFLLSARLRPLLWQVTAFTVAHTVTLGLSMYGVVALPSRIVEPLIALSIAYVAIENLVTSELRPWRPALVFGFGLLHGLGFAGVLRELGLPAGRLATALAGFNIGVELGQLAVRVLAFLLVGRFRERPWYRRTVVLPASALIGLTGLWWTIRRILEGV